MEKKELKYTKHLLKRRGYSEEQARKEIDNMIETTREDENEFCTR